jgi:membrane-bound lytic murein transglycosylase F
MKRRLLATKKLLRRIAVGGILITLTLTNNSSRTQTTLEQVIDEQTLRIITFVGPTTYFENAKGPNGFEYFLAKAFADSLEVKLEVTLIDNLDAMFNALGGPRGHFAGAGLTVTPQRKQFLRFSNAYSTVRQTLVYRLAQPRPKTIEDLIGGKLAVIANSSHEEHLVQLKEEHPQLQWQALRDTEMLDLMQQVHDGELDYALVDSTAFAIDRSLYPKARAAFELTEEEPVAWIFPGHGDTSLIKAANRFLRDFETSGELEALKTQFYDHTDEFSVGGSQLFMSRINQRLGDYQALFKTVATEFQLDWQLLAAMAYQESHWDPQATSPTGVRGLMMLTQGTAADLNVTDRLDPEQSIRGGAQYLVNILKRMPADITEPDRTWLALAAYNVGMGHLEDARVLTDRAKKDPDLWRDIRQYLPLLGQKKYYQTVKHGYARGREPVQYVQNIRHFKSILQWHDIQQRRLKALLENELSTVDNFHSDFVLPL